MEPSINIPLGFAKENFSESWWLETSTILRRYGLNLSDLSATEEEAAVAVEPVEEWELPDLSAAQARKLVTNVSDRVRATFRFVAEAPESGFTTREVAKVLGDHDPRALRGVWAGITRRLRSVLDDEDARLFQWDEVESEETWRGRVSPTTHRSLRKVLGLD